jgi:tRNA(Ile)-lysidine synthase
MRNRRARYPTISSFARSILIEWRRLKLPTSGETVIVAVSGGADSTALLLTLDEIRKSEKTNFQICVAHFDHRIRASSGKEAKWVTALASKLGYISVVGRARVEEIAREKSDNLEQAARELRYDFLERTARRKKANVVLTAHTMDDQAETVLMRLMRGSGDIGLGAIDSVRKLKIDSKIDLVRPLLWARRADTVDYCEARGVEYFNDEMNHDESFARVKVRKQLIPLMQSFNNKVVEALSRTAGLLREDGAFLYSGAAELLKAATQHDDEGDETEFSTLNVKVLVNAPVALRRRAIRQWIIEVKGNARRLEQVHLLAVERLLANDAGGKVVELPGGIKVKRRRGLLEIELK